MSLEHDLERRLGSVRIGMLALNDGRYPLVNPAAFHYSGGSVWMTTSRYATKLAMARRDPRVGFVVATPDRSLLFQGLLETYDLLSLGGSLRAALDGPRFGLSMAGYVVKNAPFVGGYLLDLARIPGQWWPQNRVVLRVRVDLARSLSAGHPPVAGEQRVEGPPADVAGPLRHARQAYLCWSRGGAPLLAPAWWAMDEEDVVAWIPSGAPHPPTRAARSALVVEAHHAFRATRMLGICLRGEVVADARRAAPRVIARRYGGEQPGPGRYVRLRPARVTWWRGFDVATVDAPPAQSA
jgi:hypothetical protein